MLLAKDAEYCFWILLQHVCQLLAFRPAYQDRSKHGLMHDVPMDKVRDCQDQFLDAMRSQHADVIETLADGKLTDDCIAVIKDTMANVAGQYKA